MVQIIRRLLAIVGVVLAVTVCSPVTAFAEDPPSDGTTTTTSAEEPEESTTEQIVEAASCGTGLVVPNPTALGDCLDTAGSVASTAGGALDSAASAVAETATEKMSHSFLTTASKVMMLALGWWIAVPGEDPQTFQTIQQSVASYTYDLQYAALIVSIILIGAKLALARSGSIRDTGEAGLSAVARAALVSGGMSVAMVAGVQLSDGLSAWIFNSMVTEGAEGLVSNMIRLTLLTGPSGVAMMIVIGIIGILGGIVMAGLLLLRSGLLIVVTAAMPIAAAAGGTKVGSQAFDKMLAWAIAFLLFKPVGSLILGVAAMTFAAAGKFEDDGTSSLVGVLLLAGCAFVMPAIMRLIAPAVGAVGGGGSGAAAAAGVATVAVGGAKLAAGGAGAGAGGAAGAAAASRSSGAPPTGSAPPSFGQAVGSSQQPSGGQNGTPSDPGSKSVAPATGTQSSPGHSSGSSHGPTGSGHGGFDR